MLAGIASIALTVLMFFPATWLSSMVENQTAGRLTLGDARGTLWRGSAFIGGAASGSDPVAALLPGRFSWRLSPMVLLGSVDAELENSDALSQPVSVTGNWHQWQVSPGAILLPAERLAALGAPLNTIQPSGRMRLSWGPLQLLRQNGKIEMTGAMNLALNDIGSRLSPVKPLGSYDLALDWHGSQAHGDSQHDQGADAVEWFRDVCRRTLAVLRHGASRGGAGRPAGEFPESAGTTPQGRRQGCYRARVQMIKDKSTMDKMPELMHTMTAWRCWSAIMVMLCAMTAVHPAHAQDSGRDEPGQTNAGSGPGNTPAPPVTPVEKETATALQTRIADRIPARLISSMRISNR